MGAPASGAPVLPTPEKIYGCASTRCTRASNATVILLLLLLIIEHTTEGAEYYLVWGGGVEWGMNGRGGGGGGGIVQAVAIVLSISSMSDCPPVTSNLPTDKNSYSTSAHSLSWSK